MTLRSVDTDELSVIYVVTPVVMRYTGAGYSITVRTESDPIASRTLEDRLAQSLFLDCVFLDRGSATHCCAERWIQDVIVSELVSFLGLQGVDAYISGLHWAGLVWLGF